MRRIFLLAGILITALLQAQAQEGELSDTSETTPLSDTSQTPSTSTKPSKDSLRKDSADTSRKRKKQKKQSDVKTTIDYSARDSIILNRTKNTVFLYGDTKIEYGNITLTAAKTKIDWEKNLLTAQEGKDSAGKTIGTPVFTQGDQQYVAKKIQYNFETEKGIIKDIVTKQGEGYVHGETVKKDSNDVMYVKNGRYTTCNLKKPHFHIKANKIKVIKDDKVISGPFNLEVEDIPTPLGFMFGFFPTPEHRSSGLIFPQIGESSSRGFYFTQGGYYWAVNDYLGIEMIGDIYTNGSWRGAVNADYKKRYAYEGNISLNYSQIKQGFTEIQPFTQDYNIKWNHRTGNISASDFTANVNIQSSQYSRNNSFETQQYLSNVFSSSVSYSHSLPGTPFNFDIRLRHEQNNRTNIVNFDLPTASFNMRKINPLEKIMGEGTINNKPLSNFGIRYSGTFENQISTSPDIPRYGFPVTNEVPEKRKDTLPLNMRNFNRIMDRAHYGASHRINLNTSFSIFQHLNLTPSFNYREFWYPQRQDYSYQPSDSAVEVSTINQFSRAHTYRTGTDFKTRMYGTFYFRNSKKIEAIRHTFMPTLNLSYQPDFSDPRFGNSYQTVQTQPGKEPERISRFQGNPYIMGRPGSGESGSIGINLQNTFEMKVAQSKDEKPDTTETGEKTNGSTSSGNKEEQKYKKVELLKSLNLNTSYNMIADSFKLSPIRLTARTNLFNNHLGLNFNSVISPYHVKTTGEDAQGNPEKRRTPAYAWNKGQGPGHITSANLNASLSLKPKNKSKGNYQTPEGTPQELDFINSNPEAYVDFSIPYNVTVNYNLSYQNNDFVNEDITQSLDVNGNIRLSEKWKVGGSSSYDFENKGIGFTKINIHRDLHCWEMTFDWIPFGRRQSFSFTIRAKATILQSLELNRRDSWYDR